MFDEHEISFNSNVATVSNVGYNQLLIFTRVHKINQFSCIANSDESWTVSFPMTEHHRELYAPLIHRHNNEQKKLAKKNSKGDNDGLPKNTPPSGGSPAAGKVVEFKSTEAVSSCSLA